MGPGTGSKPMFIWHSRPAFMTMALHEYVAQALHKHCTSYWDAGAEHHSPIESSGNGQGAFSGRLLLAHRVDGGIYKVRILIKLGRLPPLKH